MRKLFVFLLITCLIFTTFTTVAFAEEASPFAIPERTKVSNYYYTIYENDEPIAELHFRVTGIWSQTDNFSQMTDFEVVSSPPYVYITNVYISGNKLFSDLYYGNIFIGELEFTIYTNGNMSAYINYPNGSSAVLDY